MADVKRYMLEWSNALGEHMGEHPDGAWVSWQDYRALQGRYDLLKSDWMTSDVVKLREELVLLRVDNERLKESQQREPKDWETVCHECDGSGWRAASY